MQEQDEAKPSGTEKEIALAQVSSLDETWQTASVGNDRTSFMRCGGGNKCNEAK